MIQEAVELVKALCRRFEGWRSRPYLCPAGIWTIGYGSTFYLDGRKVTPADPPISPEAGERLLEKQILSIYAPATMAAVPTADTAGRQAALIDFCFNLGPTRLKASTLRKRALARDWAGVSVELRKWTRGGGKILPGLVRRAEARVALL